MGAVGRGQGGVSDTYTKLFSSITESTVWGESYATRIVWVTMLAMADAKGAVYGSVPGLARRANVTLQEVETALAAFMAPDAYSRTKDEDGRRIEEIDGGWRLINHAKYSAVRNAEERREYKRKWDQENRSKSKKPSDKSDSNPTNPTGAATPALTPTPEDQEQKQERSPKGSRLPDGWAPSDADIAFAKAECPAIDWRREADKFRDYWQSKAGRDARKLDWHKTWCNWIRNSSSPRAGPNGQAQPSRQAQGVASILGVNPHDLVADFTRTLVPEPVRPVLGEPVPAQPRRLPGG